MRAAQAELPGNGRAAAITRAVVLLGKALGMSVVAGGGGSKTPLSLASCERSSVMRSRAICPRDPRRMSRLSTGLQREWELGGIPMLAPATNELLPSQSP
jgi:hypothetical protein